MRKRQENPNSFRTLLIFCVVVTILILISLSIKAFTIIKASKFDGSHRFTLVINYEGNKKTEILSFDPKNKTISKAEVTSKQKTDLNKALGLYVDGTIQLKSEKEGEEQVSKQMLSLATRFNTAKTNITALDLFRLSLVASTISHNKIAEKKISLPSSEVEIDKIILSLFSDPNISEENIAVEIINATGTPGFGRRLERVLNNMGGQVIAVTTARSGKPASKIYYVGKSYTLEKIEKITNRKGEESENKGIADIQVVLGKDTLSTKSY